MYSSGWQRNLNLLFPDNYDLRADIPLIVYRSDGSSLEAVYISIAR